MYISDGLYLHPGGPYVIRDGDDVTILCTFIPQMPDMDGAKFGIEKLTHKQMFLFIVQNETVESVYRFSPARLQIGNHSFGVTFTASSFHQGEYRCVYNHLPLIIRSNSTSVTVEGYVYFLVLK